MIDEDDLRLEGNTAYPAAFLEHLAELAEEDRTCTVPFDLERSVSFNPYVFGSLGDGAKIGRWARFKGGTVKSAVDGTELEIEPAVGQIVGDLFGRVILFAEDSYYIGWLRSDDFEYVPVFEANTVPWIN
jgi:hypothetical protein